MKFLQHDSSQPEQQMFLGCYRNYQRVAEGGGGYDPVSCTSLNKIHASHIYFNNGYFHKFRHLF